MVERTPQRRVRKDRLGHPSVNVRDGSRTEGGPSYTLRVVCLKVRRQGSRTPMCPRLFNPPWTVRKELRGLVPEVVGRHEVGERRTGSDQEELDVPLGDTVRHP